MKPKIRRLLLKDYLDQRGSMNNKMILLSTYKILIQTQEPYRLHPLKRDLNYEKSRYTIRQQEITLPTTGMNPLWNRTILWESCYALHAPHPRARFHNKGGVLSLNILGCIIHLEERCARAQLSTLLDCRRSARPEKKRKREENWGSRTKVSYGGSNFDSGTPPPSPPFDRRAWRIHGGAAPATHVRRILRSGLMNDAIVRARSFLLADRRDVIFKYGFGLLVCDRTFLTA